MPVLKPPAKRPLDIHDEKSPEEPLWSNLKQVNLKYASPRPSYDSGFYNPRVHNEIQPTGALLIHLCSNGEPRGWPFRVSASKLTRYSPPFASYLRHHGQQLNWGEEPRRVPVVEVSINFSKAGCHYALFEEVMKIMHGVPTSPMVYTLDFWTLGPLTEIFKKMGLTDRFFDGWKKHWVADIVKDRKYLKKWWERSVGFFEVMAPGRDISDLVAVVADRCGAQGESSSASSVLTLESDEVKVDLWSPAVVARIRKLRQDNISATLMAFTVAGYDPSRPEFFTNSEFCSNSECLAVIAGSLIQSLHKYGLWTCLVAEKPETAWTKSHEALEDAIAHVSFEMKNLSAYKKHECRPEGR